MNSVFVDANSSFTHTPLQRKGYRKMRKSKVKRVVHEFVPIVFVTLLFTPESHSQVPGSYSLPDDIYWSDQFNGVGYPFNGGQANVLFEYNGELIIGGSFSSEGAAPGRNIVAWDGTKWHKFGQGINDWGVWGLTSYQGNLVASGAFDSAGGIPALNVAMWNGSQWVPLGAGLNAYVSDVATYHSKLYAWGEFTMSGTDSISNLAIWDGQSWKGSASRFNGYIYDLEVFEDKLYVGGTFTMVGDTPATHIAVFNDTVWSSVGGGTNGPVGPLSGVGDLLYAGGAFDTAGGVSANNIAVWDGNSWFGLGEGTNGSISSISKLGKGLIAQGSFSTAGTDSADGFAIWDGVDWHPLDTTPWVNGYSLDCRAYKGELVVAGRFVENQFYEHKLVVWTGAEWRLPYQLGCDGQVFDFEIYDGQLVLCGAFNFAGTEISPMVAGWGGSQWHSLTGHLMDRAEWSWPVDMTVFNDELIVAGGFQKFGDLPLQCVGAWDGSSWRSLMNSPHSAVGALCVWDQKLVAGGRFFIDGDTIHPKAVMTYDGVTWVDLGEGLGAIGLSDPEVYCVMPYETELVVAGSFDSAGAVAANDVAVWDGQKWSALGEGLGPGPSYNVHTLADYNGEIVAGGSFIQSGDSTLSSIAKWNGNLWRSLGSGVRLGSQSGYVYAMTVYDNKLIVGGWFDSAGSVATNNIAAWDGSQWSALGSGTDTVEWHGFNDGAVRGLGVYNGNLMVGGEFTVAGGHVSSFIAMWTKKDPVAVAENDTNRVLPGQFELLQNYPNPFNPSTTISFTMGRPDIATIEIFNMLGQRVRTLLHEMKIAGPHTVEWDGKDDRGNKLASGAYLYRVIVGDAVDAKKMLLLK